MATANQLAKEKAIKDAFDKLSDKRDPKTKARVYTMEYCLATVAAEFFMQPKTVEKIVNGWGNYKRPEATDGQMSIFDE